MNGLGFEILTRTHVSQLPTCYIPTSMRVSEGPDQPALVFPRSYGQDTPDLMDKI